MLTSASHTCSGDSITLGTGDPAGNGYRRDFLNIVQAASPSFGMSFIGPFTSGDVPTQDAFGVSGTTAGGLNLIVPVYFGPGKLMPDTMTVLIGTNNATSQANADLFVTDYPALMASFHSLIPSCGFVVSYLPPSAQGSRQQFIDVINGELPSMWDTMEGSGYILERAAPRLYGPADFSPSEGAAWLHPSPIGYQKLAQTWSDAYLRLIARL